MFLGFCCKVLLRKKGVRVLCGIELYVTLPLLRAGDIHDRGVQAGILTNCLLVSWARRVLPLGELHLSSGVFLLGTSIFLEGFPLEREEFCAYGSGE